MSTVTMLYRIEWMNKSYVHFRLPLKHTRQEFDTALEAARAFAPLYDMPIVSITLENPETVAKALAWQAEGE